MDYVALKSEMDSGPLAQDIMPHLAANEHQVIADLLNDPAKGAMMPVSTFINARSLMSKLGAAAGATVLETLSALVTTNPVIKWSMSFIQSEGGIDIGDAQAQGMVDQLVAGGALTQVQGNALKALGQRQASRAELLFGIGTALTDTDIREALNAR